MREAFCFLIYSSSTEINNSSVSEPSGLTHVPIIVSPTKKSKFGKINSWHIKTTHYKEQNSEKVAEYQEKIKDIPAAIITAFQLW